MRLYLEAYCSNSIKEPYRYKVILEGRYSDGVVKNKKFSKEADISGEHLTKHKAIRAAIDFLIVEIEENNNGND